MKSSAASGGLQLLSPTMQLRATAANYAAYTTNLADDNNKSTEKPTVFDFDGFTLESVRRREQGPPPSASAQSRTYQSGGSFHHVSHSRAPSSSGGSPRSPSNSLRTSTRFHKVSSYDRMPHNNGSTDGYESGSARSMDEYEWNNRSTHLSSVSSNNRPYLSHLSSMSSVGTRSKRMSVASSTTSSAMPGSSRGKQRAEVVMRGWLQRRRGRMIKRWKAQFCVLKSDQKLCLYASEDTVNGRLEGRFQLLRVTYHEKNGSFQMIGIGSDETPYKEEFRPMDDDGWRFWFQALRVFFDAASIRVALDRMPELSLVPGVDATLLNEADDEDDDVDGGNFAQEVEEMIMRPYANVTPEERGSASNTSSLSSGTSSTHQAPVHPSILSGGDNAFGSVRRKTVVVNPEARRASIEKILTAAAKGRARIPSQDNQAEDANPASERQHYLSANPARASQRIQWSGGYRAKSSSNAGVPPSILDEPLDRRPEAIPVAPVPADCPMIERDSQNNPMPILERVGSESVVSNTESENGSYAWGRHDV